MPNGQIHAALRAMLLPARDIEARAAADLAEVASLLSSLALFPSMRCWPYSNNIFMRVRLFLGDDAELPRPGIRIIYSLFEAQYAGAL